MSENTGEKKKSSDEEKLELFVRRFLSKEELEVRRFIADELTKHREYLQAQFRNITIGVGTLFTLGGLIFAFLVGQNFESAERQIIQQVDQKVIEYRILDNYKKRLSEQLKIIAQSDQISSIINEAVRNSVNDQLDEKVVSLVSQQIEKQLSSIQDESLEDLIARIINNNKSATLRIHRTERMLEQYTKNSKNISSKVEDLDTRVEELEYDTWNFRTGIGDLEDEIGYLESEIKKLEQKIE